MECAADAGRPAVQLICPAEIRWGPQIWAPPSKRVMKPVGPNGDAPPGAETATAAVKGTLWPDLEGLAAEVRVTVVSALLTVWVTGGFKTGEGLGFPSREYWAKIGWPATGSAAVVQVARPE